MKKMMISLAFSWTFLASISAMSEGFIYEPTEELTPFSMKVAPNFSTMENITTKKTIKSFQELGLDAAFRLASTKKLSNDVYVVDKYNYPKNEEGVPTLIVVAGKPNLEDSFGGTQNGAVTIETRKGIKKLDQEFQILFFGIRGGFAKEISSLRNLIYKYMVTENLSSLDEESARKMLEEDKWIDKKDFPNASELISSFVANSTQRAVEHDKASFVVTQLWKIPPYGNPNNLGIMYVVPPEKSDTINNKQIWLNLLYDTGRNVIANSATVLKEQKMKDENFDKLAVQVHLPGAGKFLFKNEDIKKGIKEEVTQNEANAVFTKGLVDGINKIRETDEGKELSKQLQLHFAYTPYFPSKAPAIRTNAIRR